MIVVCLLKFYFSQSTPAVDKYKELIRCELNSFAVCQYIVSPDKQAFIKVK